MTKGYLQIYTGNGKGKTTAAIGQGIRANGHGWNVYLLQFMKGPPFPEYGEIKAINNITGFRVEQHPTKHLVEPDDITDKEIKTIEKAMTSLEHLINDDGDLDMLIVDEICTACHFGLAETSNVTDIISDRPPEMDIVLTGRYAPESLTSQADIVTGMKNKKHPYQTNENPRKGIEW